MVVSLFVPTSCYYWWGQEGGLWAKVFYKFASQCSQRLLLPENKLLFKMHYIFIKLSHIITICLWLVFEMITINRSETQSGTNSLRFMVHTFSCKKLNVSHQQTNQPTCAIDLMSTSPPPLASAAQELAMKMEAAATDNGERPHTRPCSFALQAINLGFWKMLKIKIY